MYAAFLHCLRPRGSYKFNIYFAKQKTVHTGWTNEVKWTQCSSVLGLLAYLPGFWICIEGIEQHFVSANRLGMVMRIEYAVIIYGTL